MTKFFTRDADAIVLVYDITRDNDFKELQYYRESNIRDEIPTNASKKKNIFLYNLILVIALAVAKSDLNKDNQVSEEEARKFAEKINALFQKTSAKNNSGIDELFESIAKKIYKNEYEIKFVSKISKYLSY